MSATRVRKLRRQQQRLKENTVDRIFNLYKVDPNSALHFGHQTFGEENFTRALRRYLHGTRARIAFVLAAKQCLQNGAQQ